MTKSVFRSRRILQYLKSLRVVSLFVDASSVYMCIEQSNNTLHVIFSDHTKHSVQHVQETSLVVVASIVSVVVVVVVSFAVLDDDDDGIACSISQSACNSTRFGKSFDIISSIEQNESLKSPVMSLSPLYNVNIHIRVCEQRESEGRVRERERVLGGRERELEKIKHFDTK